MCLSVLRVKEYNQDTILMTFLDWFANLCAFLGKGVDILQLRERTILTTIFICCLSSLGIRR